MISQQAITTEDLLTSGGMLHKRTRGTVVAWLDIHYQPLDSQEFASFASFRVIQRNSATDVIVPKKILTIIKTL